MFTPFPTTENFLPYLNKAAETRPAAVYTFYAGGPAVAFVKQYAQSALKDVPLYAAGFLTEGSVLDAQGTAATGIRNVLNYSPTLPHAANQAVRGRLVRRRPPGPADDVRDGLLRRRRGPRPRPGRRQRPGRPGRR